MDIVHHHCDCTSTCNSQLWPSKCGQHVIQTLVQRFACTLNSPRVKNMAVFATMVDITPTAYIVDICTSQRAETLFVRPTSFERMGVC